MTSGDVARIAAHTGASGFTHRTRPTDPAYFEHDPDDPNWVRYTIAPDGTRQVLKKQDGREAGAGGVHGRAGDCTFLGKAGCVLPEEVRPLVCRLYPFMYTERGLDGVDESYCPTEMFFPKEQRGDGAPGRARMTMLTVLRMDPADGERWRGMLYGELRGDLAAREGGG